MAYIISHTLYPEKCVRWGLVSVILSGPCVTTVTWCCRKNFANGSAAFFWKLCCHWLKGLQQCQITVVRQGPVLWYSVDLCGLFTHILQGCFGSTGELTWLAQCQWSNPEGYQHSDRQQTKNPCTTEHKTSLTARFMGPTPIGPRWAPCWPQELCYLGCAQFLGYNSSSNIFICNTSWLRRLS